MTARSVSLEGSGPVRTVRLHRPPVNALDVEALRELGATADAVSADTQCRVVVLASAIEGVFCAGGDLKFWQTFPRELAPEVSLAGRETFARIARIPKPTIAIIDGPVIGDGIALALSCDLRLASSRASFRLPEAGYGFIPGWGTLHHLVRTVGRTRSLDMILTGRTVDASSALEWGLVSRVERTDRLATGLDTLLDDLLTMSPTALCLAKAALMDGWEDPSGIPDQETNAFVRGWGSPDWQEGIAALLAKRPPRFATGWTSIPGDQHDP